MAEVEKKFTEIAREVVDSIYNNATNAIIDEKDKICPDDYVGTATKNPMDEIELKEWIKLDDRKNHEKDYNFRFMYELEDSIQTKIEKVSKNVYGAEGVKFSEKAKETIETIEKLGYGNLPICIAKTQYSFSDDAKNLECEEPFDIHVEDVVLKTGAGFVVVLTGKIMTMPGLPRVPAAEKIDIDESGEIVGIF